MSGILALGAYAPQRVMKNEEFEAYLDTSDEWIVTRTGIRERRIAAEDEYTSDLAFKAVEDLLKSCLLYTSPSPRDRTRSRMPSSA